MDTIDKVALIYLEGRKALSSLSKGKDAFYFPGGKREKGETDLQTLTREIKEELSVDIEGESARFYGVFEAQAHGKAAGVKVRMTCYTAAFTGELRPDNEIERIVWVTSADRDRVSPVDKLILDDLLGKGLID